MSVSAVAPTPFYQDPDRLPIGLPEPKAEAAQAGKGKKLSMFAEGDEEPSFWDLLDVVNPLQHIPLVNDIYRELTGDKIGVGARLAGGTLFGGPIGLIAAATNAMIEEGTGETIGGHALALFRDEGETAPDPQLAQDTQPPAAATAASAPAVSSSPAKAEAAEAVAAPVITLPEGAPAKGPAGPTMMFSMDGAAPVAAPPVQVAQAPLPPLQPQAQAQQAAGQPMNIGPKPARMMPAPGRNADFQPPAAPPISVPVSNSSTRSNMPITGRSPTTAVAPSPAAVQRALAGQEVPAGHPMLPPSGDAAAAGQQTAQGDWFTAAWSQALDKYERTSQRAGKTAPTTTTLQ